MQIGDQVQIRCSKFDPMKMENVEAWKIGRVTSFDDFSFKLEFLEDDGSEYETFSMNTFEQREARLIPTSTFSSMFYE